MKLIKITTSDMRGLYGTKWEIGGKRSIYPDYRKPKLCTEGVFHAYTSLEQALLMKNGHGWFEDTFRIFEAEGKSVVDDGTKCGCYELTLIKELYTPEWYEDGAVFGSIARYALDALKKHYKGFPVSIDDSWIRRVNFAHATRAVACNRLDYLSSFEKIDFPALVAEAKKRAGLS